MIPGSDNLSRLLDSFFRDGNLVAMEFFTRYRIPRSLTREFNDF